MNELTLEELWESAPRGDERFDPATIAHLPEPARRYLNHAIAPGTVLAKAVRLSMHGTIRLHGDWHAFEAEQVIRWDRGMIWRARAKMHPGWVTGADRLIDGEGAMRWKLFGLVPVMESEGPDVTRAAAGRLEVESIWLPSVLMGDAMGWSAADAEHPHVDVRVAGEHADVELTIDHEGALQKAALLRWGQPEGDDAYHWVPFGGFVDAEARFGGYTIPSELRVGWHFGSERFASEGEFFRCTLTEAEYR